ncbi:hypothetical protein [Alienimonas californiensis]|uniref:Uncharacterized protein n=1 Tax=Alienimonas californiensis TaxID=2527989 RepID=A0A517P6P7_9PLAN|nr:hypothetical protein [Alienimonas californiensis]QDT15060.1 hypothetical protein CA12_11400 [Alienimonas californiensis]
MNAARPRSAAAAYARTSAGDRRGATWAGVAGILALAALLALGGAAVWQAYQLGEDAPVAFPAPAAAPTPVVAPVEPPAPTPAEVYAQEILPLMTPFEARNRAAVGRAVNDLREAFGGFSAGVPVFTEDMMTFNTRGVLAKRTAQDWWAEDGADRVGAYVDRKVARYVVSDAKLRDAVARAAERLRADLLASRNTLLADVDAALSARDLAVRLEMDPAGVKRVRAAFDDRLRVELRADAADSLRTMILSEVGGELIGYALTQILTRLVVQAATRAAAAVGVSALASGSAMVGGAAGGGAAGTVGGPAGVAAGIAGGVIVGLAIDWWMSERLEAQLAGTMRNYLDALERSLIEGGHGAPGVRDEFAAAARRLNADAAEALRAAVLGDDA